MIKVIAFDLVGVLLKEKDVDLTKEQIQLERLFNSDRTDDIYNEETIRSRQDKIRQTTMDIFKKLYEQKYPGIMEYLRKKHPNIKLIIASNHVSHIKDYLKSIFDVDEIFVSTDLGVAKPDPKFFDQILKRYNILPNEMLFLDDKEKNVASATTLGIYTIRVYSNMNIVKEIQKFCKNCI